MLKSSAFVPEIEGLRGLLSLIVVAAHVYAAPLFWAWGCMELFFVISGFLIGRQILCHHREEGFLKNYFVRRAIRIWPAYYFFLLLTVVANFVWDAMKYGDPWHKLTWIQIVTPLFFLQNASKYFTDQTVQNLTYNDVPYHFGHSWSVAIEEHFYFLAPFVLISLWKWGRSPVAWGILVVLGILTSVIFRVDHSYWLIVGRLDGFLVGVLIAYVWRQKPDAHKSQAPAAAWMPVLLCALYGSIIVGHYIYTGYAVGFKDQLYGRVFDFSDPVRLFVLNPYVGFALLGGCLVYCSVFNQCTRMLAPLRMRWLQFLGRISYSTYLCHVLIVGDIVPRILGTHGTERISVWSYVLSYTLTLACAHLSHSYIETCLFKYKAKFDFVARASQRRTFACQA